MRTTLGTDVAKLRDDTPHASYEGFFESIGTPRAASRQAGRMILSAGESELRRRPVAAVGVESVEGRDLVVCEDDRVFMKTIGECAPFQPISLPRDPQRTGTFAERLLTKLAHLFQSIEESQFR